MHSFLTFGVGWIFALLFFSVRVDWMCVGQRVVEDGGRHLGGVKFNFVCVDRHTVYVCVWGLAGYIKLTAAEIGAAASRFIPATVLTSGCYDGYLPLFYSLMSISISFLPSTWDNNLAVNVPGISVTPPSSCRGSYWNVFNMVTSLMMLACPLDCYFFFFFFSLRLVFANERPRFGWFFFFLRLDHFDWKSFEPDWWCGSLWFGSAVADSLRQLCSTKVTKNRKKKLTKKLPLIRATGSFRLIFLSTISSFLFYFSLTQRSNG